MLTVDETFCRLEVTRFWLSKENYEKSSMESKRKKKVKRIESEDIAIPHQKTTSSTSDTSSSESGERQDEKPAKTKTFHVLA